MKIVYTGPEEEFDAAMVVLSAELRGWRDRYTKLGWGWSFGPRDSYIRSRFFVRRLKDGLSIKCTPPTPKPQDGAGERP